MEQVTNSISTLISHARTQLAKTIVGQQEMLDHCIVAILCGGHILLEGVPGVAKTLAVRSVARLLQLDFQRIQCTSDLMPADITGTNVFNQQNSSFQFHRGPLFADLVLVDEINRMPPRTQAALLEAMEERRVTVDGKPYPLSAAFTVFATQNPVDFEGTYPLPEAQLDRFLIKVIVPYPDAKQEVAILSRYQSADGHNLDDAGLEALPAAVLEGARNQLAALVVEPTLLEYAVRIARATRETSNVSLGASPRAALNLLYVSKAYAALDGRDYLIPDDVKRAAIPVLRHRLILKPEAQLEGLSTDQVLTDLIARVELPK
jgi:MoxR-like ATPase